MEEIIDKLIVFRLYLAELALYWLISIEQQGKIATWQQMEKLFLENYTDQAAMIRIKTFKLKDRKQGETETVDEYINAIIMKCVECNKEKDDTFKIETFIMGLKEKLKTYVLDKDPNNFKENASMREKQSRFMKM